MEKIFNVIPSVKEAFACWFVLQHLRGYRPFLTKVMVEKEFTGNIHEGREARRTRQKNTKVTPKNSVQEFEVAIFF